MAYAESIRRAFTNISMPTTPLDSKSNKLPVRPDASSSARRALVAGGVTTTVGLALILLAYLALDSSDTGIDGEHPSPEFIGELNRQSQAEALESLRAAMPPEQFENTFGPAIQHERDNPPTVIGSSADLDNLPAFVELLVAPTITDAGLARLAQRI